MSVNVLMSGGPLNCKISSCENEYPYWSNVYSKDLCINSFVSINVPSKSNKIVSMLIRYFSSPSFFNSSPNKCDTYRDDDRHHKPNGKQRPDWNPERNENDCIFDNRMACDKKDKRQHHIFSRYAVFFHRLDHDASAKCKPDCKSGHERERRILPHA